MALLPYEIVRFCLWWLFGAPRKIFIVSRRFVQLTANELSFSLNIQLLVTPLFGDYTVVGRFIGFTFRITQILFGLPVLIVLNVISLVLPLLWWFVPIAAAPLITFWLVPVVLACFGGYVLTHLETPERRVLGVSGVSVTGTNGIAKPSLSALESCFRPKALTHLNHFKYMGFSFFDQLRQEPAIVRLLKRMELNNSEFLAKISQAGATNVTDIATGAFNLAKDTKCRYVEIEHVFLAALAAVPKIDNLLATYNTDLKTCSEATDWVVQERERKSRKHFWQDDYVMPEMGGIGRGMTGRVTPLLDSVSEDFTRAVKYYSDDRFVANKEKISEIVDLLGGSKDNVLIVGEPGSGKTTLVRNIALEILRGTKNSQIKFKRIVSIEPGALIAGTRTQGDIAGRLKKVMEEVESSGDIILFIDEIHNLVTSENSQDTEVSNIYSILGSHLSSGNVQFIGATTIQNYRKFIEPNGAFARLFNMVEIQPASKADTLEILKTFAYTLETRHGVLISYPALKKNIELSDKLMHDRVFPDKAIEILARTITGISKESKYVTAESIAKEISEITHVPVTTVTEDESQKLLLIDKEMKKQVIGQDEAINQIASSLRRARIGIRNESKPIASFLFVGTTGVGKTETAKALARTYFGDSKCMIRLDMSEYQQIDSIDKLIGTPDGKTKGILTEAVRTKPFALILLDEIEKASANVLLTFLQVLDDARLTDSTGRVIDFTNTIIIATSNAGTKAIQEVAKREGPFDEMQNVAMKEVRDRFAPEFLNRYSGIIVFKPLTLETVKLVANLMLGSVKKLAADKNITITFKPELIDELVKRGFNPEWGARPLARVIENTVESYLAIKILAKELKSGDSTELGLEVFQN